MTQPKPPKPFWYPDVIRDADPRRRCAQCNAPMDYHQWACVDGGTGDHLGDYKLWRCEKCDVTIDVSRDSA